MNASAIGRPAGARVIRRPLDRFEQSLMEAKNGKKIVFLDLAVSTRHTDDDGTMKCHICQVDKYTIEVLPIGAEKKIWIAKSMIVHAEVQ